MALIVANRILETCNAPGTGAVTLLGAITGYRTFSAAIGNGNTCYYTIADQSGANWEVGLGTYASAGNTLTRTTPLSGSAATPVNFSSGTQNVFVTYPSEKSVYLDASGAVSLSGALGIGATPSAGNSLHVTKTITGSTTSVGIRQAGVVASDVTTESFGIINSLSTQAATFTLPSYVHYGAVQGTIGAGSVVTSQYGVYIANLTSATNNYGIFSGVTAATGRYNLYMQGTADNYLGGPLITAKVTATSAAAPTIASATTIAPTTSIVFISGTTPIATITPPSPISLGGGQITLIPTGLFTTTTAGNIALASTAVVSKALIMTYDVTTAKWYPSY